MSFLNPVNEPVMRFSSTDAGAPQINYNARVAGDIKAVLKACLVTGYGAKASAGWTAVNETATVIEFVSPSAAMSDYRLGIDDTSAASTTWYYRYQNVRIEPTYNTPIKTFAAIDSAHVANGWQLFVTERGILLIEIVQHVTIKRLSTRITYWGRAKSGLQSETGENLIFFNIGHDGAITNPAYIYSSNTYVYLRLESHISAHISAATSNVLSSSRYKQNESVVDLVSQMYIASAGKDLLLGELPPMLSKVVNSTTDIYGVNESVLDTRPVLSVCAGLGNSNVSYSQDYARTFLIRLDYWEY